MSVQSELERLQSAKAAIKAAIEGKGVTVPDATLLDGMAALIESIEAGGGDIAFGSFTPTEDCNYYEITHNLGKIPDFACCFHPGTTNGTFIVIYDDGSRRGCTFKASSYLNGVQFPVNSSYLHTQKTGSKISDSGMFNASETTVFAGNNVAESKYLLSGLEYFWIVGVCQ